MTVRQVWILLPFLLLVSGIYWYSSRSLLKSLHGIAVLMAFGYAVWICEKTESDPLFQYYIPMYILLVGGLASMAFSLKAFAGKKMVHLIHSLTLISIFLIWVVGSMAISHDWI